VTLIKARMSRPNAIRMQKAFCTVMSLEVDVVYL